MTHTDADGERAIMAEMDRLEGEFDALKQDVLAKPMSERAPGEFTPLLLRLRDVTQRMVRLALLAAEPKGRA